jgi:uncharacterized protein involved in tolerance to divalent cations
VGPISSPHGLSSVQCEDQSPYWKLAHFLLIHNFDARMGSRKFSRISAKKTVSESLDKLSGSCIRQISKECSPVSWRIKINKSTEVELLFLEALKMKPHNVEILAELMNIQFHLHKFDQLVVTADGLIALDPDNGRAYCNCSAAQRRLGRNTEAFESATKGCKLGYELACRMISRGVARSSP